MSNCSCDNPGWCERHKMTKAPHLHHLCKTRAGYCAMWDRKASGEKLQTKPPPEPGWVRFVSLFKVPEDTGVGDTVARYAAMLGGELFTQWSKRIGLPCGCTERQAQWNTKYPYTEQTDQQQS